MIATENKTAMGWIKKITFMTAVLSLGFVNSFASAGNNNPEHQRCHDDLVSTTPTDAFIVLVDGAVLDKRTGLVWYRCALGQSFNRTTNQCDGEPISVTWQGALQSVESTNSNGGTAGYQNWRLPNIKELGSLVERSCFNPALNIEIFPFYTQEFGAERFWSSTAMRDGQAQRIYYLTGDMGSYGMSNDQYVLIVRNNGS